jgi:hypothetical protein
VPPASDPRTHETASLAADDPPSACVDEDLLAWLAWLRTAQAARVDRDAMRRLELVCSVGWIAVLAAALAIPSIGAPAAALSLLLLCATLFLACVAAPTNERQGGAGNQRGSDCPRLGAEERAQLVRIINLSRVAGRPSAGRLLLSELEEAPAIGSLAGWAPLCELRDIVRAGDAGIVPYDS